MSITKLMDITERVFVIKYIQSTEIGQRVPKHLYGIALRVNSSLMNYVALDTLIPISIYPTKKEDLIYDEEIYYLEEIVAYGERIKLEKNQLCWLPDNNFYRFQEDKMIQILEDEKTIMEQISLAQQYVRCMEEKDLYSGLCTTQIVQNRNSKIIEKEWIHAYQNEKFAIDLDTLRTYPILKLDANNYGTMELNVDYVYPICPYETKYENGEYLEYFDDRSDIDLIKKLIRAYQLLEYPNPSILNFSDHQKRKK